MNWAVETNYPRTPAFRVVTPAFPGSAVLNTIVETDDEEAARLIAAAPDLLAALRMFVAAFPIPLRNDEAAAIKAGRAAIAKAALTQPGTAK